MNWQQVIDWIDGMARRNELFAGDLREGLAALQAEPLPRPAVVEEKIGAWAWLLDNNQIPEAEGDTDTGFVSEAASNPLVWLAGAALAFLIFKPKRRS